MASITVQTIEVPHLGGTKAGYAVSGPSGTSATTTTPPTIDRSKPVVVMLNSMCMTAALYADQFSDERLTAAATLVAVEPLGHGATRCPAEHFTYWDSAVVALQVLDALGVESAYALGTSQGGWIVPRMALLAPERIKGLIIMGTSMDAESEDSRAKGCWNPAPLLMPFFEQWCAAAPDGFVVDDAWCGLVGSMGFGERGTPEMLSFWADTLRKVYRGPEGRRMTKMALLNLIERDGLLLRLRDIRCPVHWLHGTKDAAFPPTVAEEQIKLFTSAPSAEVTIIPEGAHYLNATHPKEIADAVHKMLGSA